MGRTCPTMRMNVHSEFVHGCSSDCHVEMRNTDTLPLSNMLLGISFFDLENRKDYTQSCGLPARRVAPAAAPTIRKAR